LLRRRASLKEGALLLPYGKQLSQKKMLLHYQKGFFKKKGPSARNAEKKCLLPVGLFLSSFFYAAFFIFFFYGCYQEVLRSPA
jgi:hypothetical protein